MKSKSISLKDLIRNKLWCLIHDPAEKMWFIKEHELNISKSIVRLDISSELSQLKREKNLWIVDGLASSVDRQLLGIFYLFGKGDEIEASKEKLTFKNIFDARYEKEIPYPNKNELDAINKDVENKLNHLFTIINEALSKYNLEEEHKAILKDILILHILYYFGELLWILNLGPTPVADIRVPAYTVFDHNSASATISNWFSGNEDFDGYIVRIDLGGIHEYISKSRKLRDLWISSYLSSGLVWMALSPLVFILGPDIILTPSLRMNPVYGFTLNVWLGEWCKDAHLNDEYSEWIEKNLKMDEVVKKLSSIGLKEIINDKNPPNYSIQPGSFTLILPPEEVIIEAIYFFKRISEKVDDNHILRRSPFKILLDSRVENYLGKNCEKGVFWIHDFIKLLLKIAWESLYKEYMSLSSLSEFLSKELSLNTEELDACYPEIKEYIKMFEETPPFVVRIYVASVKEAMKLLKDIEDEYAKNDDGKSEFRKGYLTPLFLEILNELLNEFQNKYYSLRHTPYTGINLTDYLEDIYSYIRGYDKSKKQYLGIKIYGKDELKVYLYPDFKDPGFYYCTSCGELPALLVNRVTRDTPFLSGGEKLCPVCLMKRIAAKEPQEIAKKIFGVDDIDKSWPRTIFISTSEISNHTLIKLIKEILPKIRAKHSVRFSKLLKHLDDMEKAKNLVEDPEKYFRCQGQIFDPEDEQMFLSYNNEHVEKWVKFIRALKDEEFYRVYPSSVSFPCISLYYGIFITDGDRMGPLLSGELYKSKTIPKLHKYIEIKDRKDFVTDFEAELDFYIEHQLNLLNISNTDINKLLKHIFTNWKKIILKRIDHNFNGEFYPETTSIDFKEYAKLVKEVSKNVTEEFSSSFNTSIIMSLTTLLGLYFYKIRLRTKRLILKPRYIPSIIYLTSISKALMNSILEDKSNILKANGVVIYAGGDDLMAVVPLTNIFSLDEDEIVLCENVLDKLVDIRKFYSLGRDSGFNVIFQRYFVPMLIGHGRSGSLLITHYRTPLSMAVEYTEYALNEIAKDGSKWIYLNKGMSRDKVYIQERDGFVLGIIRSGRPKFVKIPNIIYQIGQKDIKVTFSLYKLKELITYINWLGEEERKISKSFLSDFLLDPIIQEITVEKDFIFTNMWENIQVYFRSMLSNILIKRNVKRSNKITEVIVKNTSNIFKVFDSLVDYKKFEDINHSVALEEIYLPFLIPRFIAILSSGWRCRE